MPSFKSMVAGLCVLLFSFCAVADESFLQSLFDDQLWEKCRVEAMRVLISTPNDYHARWYSARSGKELGMDVGPAFAELGNDPDAPSSVRWPARYEEAMLLWHNGERAASAEALREVFLNTSDPKWFLLSGCTLALALREEPMPWGGAEGIGPALRTSSLAWSDEIRDVASRHLAVRKRVSVMPGGLLISLYRTQIRPAIGDRCSLQPSCSEYSRQAFAKHGLFLGIPMMADRFIREPGVVSAADHQVTINGRTLIADPLCEHDWWFSSSEGIVSGDDCVKTR